MRTRWIIAAVLLLVGVVWIGQGLGIFRGSGFMDGDVRWAAIGTVLAVVGIVIAWTAFRARRRV
jgi:type VI protein secretion system component VasK